MRELVFARLVSALVEDPYLQVEFDITPEELHAQSNEYLLNLFEDITVFYCEEE